ncbi:MAG: 2-phospho-L-lactate guanylyltransferase [Anaerolineae bacterium]
MSVWIIIPVKPLAKAKSRLASVLSPEQRAQLAEALMRHTISVVTPIKEVAGTLVVSRDTKALSIARDLGVHTVQESGTPELNHALMRATQVAIGFRGEAVLILPADLPLVTSEDILGMIELGREDNTLVIATDSQGDGTNAMLTRPPGLIPYVYGVGSYERHLASAREVGAIVRRYHSDRLALDIDMPEDLDQYYRLVGDTGAVPPLASVNGAGRTG